MHTDLYTPVLKPCEPGLRLDPARVPWRNGLLIRATNWLGDALMTLPAVYRLSRAVPYPCGVFVLCPEALQPLWEAAPWVSQVIPMAGKRCSRGEAACVRRLRPGVAVVLPNSFGAAWDVFLTGAPVRLGRRGRLRGWLLTHRLPEWPRERVRSDRHQLSRYLELAAAFGPVEWSANCPPLRLPDPEALAGRLGVQAAQAPWLALAPGAAYGPAKQWPAERFAAVARWWRGRGGSVAVVGTRTEQGAGEAVRAAVPEALNLAGKTSLRELMAVLAVCTLAVTNDSGAMHLGAAMGCRGVAIFGSTDPVATGPIGGRWVLLADPPPCAPCLRRTCPRPEDPCECLRRIEPAMVIAAAEKLLASPAAG